MIENHDDRKDYDVSNSSTLLLVPFIIFLSVYSGLRARALIKRAPVHIFISKKL